MKTHHRIATICATALIFVAGCGKTESSGGGATGGASSGGAAVSVDTSKFTEAFKSAAVDVKPVTDAVVSAVKGADYSAAMAKLQELASKYKITPEQTQAANDLLANVQKALGGAATKATESATKAVNDLGNALKK